MNLQDLFEELNSHSQVFWKFLSPNDVGLTGGHQCGVLISISCSEMLFDVRIKEQRTIKPILKRIIKLEWPQIGKETESCFTYYESKHELRLTRFGKDFPLLKPEENGDLFLLARVSKDAYKAYVISEEENIQDFLAFFNVSPIESNSYLLTKLHKLPGIEALRRIAHDYIATYKTFPDSVEMSRLAREYVAEFHVNEVNPTVDPDKALLTWTGAEYDLFREFESEDFKARSVFDQIKKDDFSISDLVGISNSILNRRKSRAGKSLEHHLEQLFIANGIRFTPQAVTEENKRPDFIFPSEEAYHDLSFPADKLFSLAAKTTCKDRWRQVLTESDRIVTKYLCTLQQGISKNQLEEMRSDNVVLVVPEEYKKDYPKEYWDMILTLKEFIEMIKKSQE